jgi:hypothetical protein
MEFDAPEELGGSGNYLSEAGTYHLAINHVWEGTGPKGGVIQGFSVGLQVLAGTVEDQEKKELNLTFFNPNLNHSEVAQRIRRQQQAAFLIASGLMAPADLGKRVSIDLNKAIGQQVIATFEENEYNGILRLRFSDIFHVDDPRAKNFPKDLDSIAMLPTEKRKGESYFAPLKAGKKTAAEQPVASSMTQSDLDEL